MIWANQTDLLQNKDKVIVVGLTKIHDNDPKAEFPLPPPPGADLASYNEKLRLARLTSNNVGLGSILVIENQIRLQDK